MRKPVFVLSVPFVQNKMRNGGPKEDNRDVSLFMREKMKSLK